MRLIDADKLKAVHGMKDDCADCDKELRGKSRSCEFDRIYSLMDFCGWVDDAPTIEPERKHGKWIKWGTEFKCDQCHLCNSVEKPYCPNCGADMREGEQDG